MTLTFVLIGICLACSMFFSMSETALTSVSKSIVTQKAKQSKAAGLIKKILKAPDQLITTLLLGNNVANVFLTTIATSFSIALFGEKYLLETGLVITAVVLVFAEILPKTIAFSKSYNVSLIIAPIIYAVLFITKPIVLLFLGFNKLLFKIFLREKTSDNMMPTIENLRGAIELLDRDHDKKILAEEKAMLHSILDLNELNVTDILKHRKDVMCLDINLSTKEILDNYVLSCPYSRLPVYNDDPDNILGVIKVTDIFKEYKLKGYDFNIKDLVIPPYFIPETTDVIALLMYFKRSKERMGLVVDEYGSFMGILTLGDIMEEITGELANSDQISLSETIEKRSQNSIIVAGDLKIRDLNRKMFWDLPDETFTTVAGLILYQTGIIPNVGSKFSFYNREFEIIEKKRHQISKIKITTKN